MSEEHSYACKICGVDLDNSVDFNYHVLSHIEAGEEYPLEPVGTPDENSFLVRCPYPGCSVRTETYNFPKHVYDTHESFHTQCFECPICRLIESETPNTPDFNLVNHLRTKHSDMVPDGPVNLSGRINDVSYTIIEESLPDDKACPFCYDEIKKGQKVAILGCLCIYHEECYRTYIEKYPEQPCIEHSQNL